MHACLVRCGRGGRVSTRWHVGGYRSSMTTQEHTSYARLASALDVIPRRTGFPRAFNRRFSHAELLNWAPEIGRYDERRTFE